MCSLTNHCLGQRRPNGQFRRQLLIGILMMTVFKSTNCGVHVTHGQKHRELLVGQDSNSTSINATESTPFLIDVTAIPETAIEKPIYERVHWASATFGIVLLVSSMIFFGMKYKSNSELLQLFLTIGLAGFGNLAAGFYLSHVQNWEVFHRVSELLVLEPTLLGLKGNIEMCMAARLSTQANLGNMDTWAKTRSMVAGNLALDLTQAGVVSSVAAIGVVVFAVFQSVTPSNFGYVLSIVLSSTLLTACTASLILGSLLVTVIIVSYKCNVNPDNIGAPIAASCGDVITLVLLANYARLVYNNTPDAPAFPVVSFVAIVCLVSSLPVWAWIAYKNEYTRRNIATGWVPIFIAVLLSTCSGFILDFAAFEYRTYAIFQPVINGVGGNLVAIHSSRMSTALHKQANLGEMPSTVKMYRSPIKAFFDKSEINIEMARNLVLMAIPAHIIYLFVTVALKQTVHLTFTFVIIYIIASLIQIVLLLYVAYHLVNFMWKHGIDPDNSVIPILTATGDFLGSLFLFFAYMILDYIGDINTAS